MMFDVSVGRYTDCSADSEKSKVCGLSRWTEMSRLRSSASLMASSSDSFTTGRPLAPAVACALVSDTPVCLTPARAAASRISSWMCWSVIFCARACEALPSSSAADATTLHFVTFHFMSEFPLRSVESGGRLLFRLVRLIGRTRQRSLPPDVLQPFVVQPLEAHPLVRAQHLHHLHEHQRARLVRVRPRRLDTVDLARQRRFVGIALNHLRQLLFELAQQVPLLSKLRPRHFPNLFDVGRLLRGEPELFTELLVLPPREGLAGGRRRLGEQRPHGAQQNERQQHVAPHKEVHR